MVATSVDDDDDEVAVYELAPGRPLRPLAMPDSCGDAGLRLVSSRDRNLVFATWMIADGPRLAALNVCPDGLELAFNVGAPHAMSLVHDPTSRRAYIIWEAQDGTHVAELGEHPPRFGEVPVREVFPSLAPHFICSPHDPVEAFDGIDDLVKAGRWDAVRDRLEAVEVSGMPPAHREHLQHVLGLAYARMGETERARSVWTRGLAYAERERVLSCDLEACLEIVEDLGVEGPGAPDSKIAQLRRVIAGAGERPALDALRILTVYRAANARASLASPMRGWRCPTVGTRRLGSTRPRRSRSFSTSPRRPLEICRSRAHGMTHVSPRSPNAPGRGSPYRPAVERLRGDLGARDHDVARTRIPDV